MSSEELERIYSVFRFPEDPFSEEGRARFRSALSEFKKVLEHEWVKSVVESLDKIHVLDLCGGTGIGGIAFAKNLIEQGKDAELTIVDLRGSALKKAKEFCRSELGFEPRTMVWDVRRIHEKKDLRSDIAIIYGYSTPHFSPWDLLRVYASVSLVMKDHSVLIVEEADRFQTIFRTIGYKDIVVESSSENNVVLTVHEGHDILSGYTTRMALDLITRQVSPMKVYYWDIAGSATLAWIFFQDVDFMQKQGRPSGYILAYKPRKQINPLSFLKNTPRILEKH